MKAVVEDEPPRNAEERVALRLRDLRTRKGLTQAVLAERVAEQGLNWHQTTVAKTERADRPLRLNEVEALARALGHPLLDLIGDRPLTPMSDYARVAADNLAKTELLHEEVAAVVRDTARAYGKAKGEADELAKLLKQLRAQEEGIAQEVREARDFLQRTLSEGEGPTGG